MQAAWDWQLPDGTEAEQRRLAEAAADCGFDTLITDDPTRATVDRAHELGLRVLAIVNPYPTAAFRSEHPDAIQRMRPVEERIAEVVADDQPAGYQRTAFRWYPVVHDRAVVCFEHPAARSTLERRVAAALDVADGVAFDCFGYRNHHACFCDRCRERRADEGVDDPAGRRRDAERGLVEVSEALYDRAKSVDPDAVVANHVWPPFRPNPRYGYRLRLDYCSQTISWFYRPAWSLERVEFEAATHARHADPERNAFVPFVGMFPDDWLARSPDRLAAELEIALAYGDGNVVFATLETAVERPAIRDAVRDALA